VSYRAVVALDVLAIIEAHQPDDTGRCVACLAIGDDEEHPCPPLAYALRAADLLARRLARAGRTTKDGDSPVKVDLSRADWRRSSHCDNSGSCVEVAFVDGAVALRSSDGPDGPIVVYSDDEWRTFIEGVRDGEFG
jgi:uncharacterized protein DUF397